MKFRFPTGYYADQLSVAQEVRGNHTVRVKNESRGFHLNNLSYAGPIVMGVGGNVRNAKLLPIAWDAWVVEWFALEKNAKKAACPQRDLNSRPLVYKTSALTPELWRLDIRRKWISATYIWPRVSRPKFDFCSAFS